MNTEHAVAEALRTKAAAVRDTPMPVLGRSPSRVTPRWLAPVAAAVVVVVAAGVAVFVLAARDQNAPLTTATPPTTAGLAPGEVYYTLRLTDLGAGGVLQEKQLWQPREQAGEWRQTVAQGTSIRDGRVVPGEGRVDALPGGVCYPSFHATDEACTKPGSWFAPTTDFLASAPRDPATIADQLHKEALNTLKSNGQSADLAPVLELRFIGELLAGNGVPAELAGALREVVTAMPGVHVTLSMANLTGDRGTGYSFTAPKDTTVTVIFAEDGHYLGSPKEAVHHGVAHGLGEPPSRMLDCHRAGHRDEAVVKPAPRTRLAGAADGAAVLGGGAWPALHRRSR